jgi:hypothetical protein
VLFSSVFLGYQQRFFIAFPKLRDCAVPSQHCAGSLTASRAKLIFRLLVLLQNQIETAAEESTINLNPMPLGQIQKISHFFGNPKPGFCYYYFLNASQRLNTA